jgi:carboxymethylenebutenolidase
VPDMTINHNGKSIPGYLAEPAEPKGGMIVIQEWWGLNDDIREIADRYAAEGFLAFAPDLYHGTLATEPDEARKLAMSLERQAAAEEIDAAIAWMKTERGVAKVGCVGFCMGGGLTLATALRTSSNVDAVHVYYGGGMPDPAQLETIRVPVMGSYGGEDKGIPKEQVDGLRDALAKAGTPNDIMLYDGAQHSFFNAGPAHHPEAAQHSWERSIGWFNQHLAA